MQHLLVRAAVDLTPRWTRAMLGLNGYGLHAWEAEALRQAGAFADRLVLAANPAVQACRRMRLPANYLYVPRSGVAVSTGPFQQATRKADAILQPIDTRIGSQARGALVVQSDARVRHAVAGGEETGCCK